MERGSPVSNGVLPARMGPAGWATVRPREECDAMLNSIDITNYRGFDRFRLDNLARVNLLTGKNNVGKTALLESVHILAAGGNPQVLMAIAERRGEVAMGDHEGPMFNIDFSHFFCGHQIATESKITLTGGNGLAPVIIEILPIESVKDPEVLFDIEPQSGPMFVMRIEGDWSNGRRDRQRNLLLSEDGAILIDSRRGFPRQFFEGRREGPPIVFITPESLMPQNLGTMWNQITVEKQEEFVNEAMRILEPNLEDIRFLGAMEPRRSYFPIRAGVVIGLKGEPRRIPLGSMGDGMRRLLALAISLNQARDGYLIIDEIDTGFHYSVMAKMWELVVQTAEKNNIQVFATTHSADCVRGLGLLAEQRTDLQHAIAAHKIERDLGHNVAFAGHEVALAFEQDIEIR